MPVALLIVGTNGIIAILLPYTAESFPLRVRGRATGWVAACTKGGGLFAQVLASRHWSRRWGSSSTIIMVPGGGRARAGRLVRPETRGGDLRDLDADGRTFAATGI